ncbi:MAG: hypothetical protein KatS3mg029_0987 [Saprospiraceae bacterium]|nr:MAG: hypothetical protein KatS3mg029_0987 [Saprospiraceae bacterium]
MSFSKNILFLAFAALAMPAAGNVWRVCANCDLTSIKAAVAQARPCDTIVVEGGTYFENGIHIDKELTLIGKGKPIIDGRNKGEIITVEANHFHLEGFRIQNVGQSYMEDWAGVRVRKAGEFLIRHNEFFDAYFAIYLQNAFNGEVSDNYIEAHSVEEANAGNAIHAWYCTGLTIARNHVKGNRDGIYFEFVDNSRIFGNLSENNIRYGLHFMFSDEDEYFDNIFRHNGAGVAVMYSRNIAMRRNIFEENWGPASYGLLLKDIYDAEISDNIFRKNTVGIFMETSNRVHLLRNELRTNGWAMRLSGGNMQTRLEQCNFLQNTFNLAVHVAGSDNAFDGNYWSDYAGYDLDGDGFGDVPHRPMSLFAYVVNRTPEAMVLLRSLFVDLLNYSEKVSPLFTPENVLDNKPLMKPVSIGLP